VETSTPPIHSRYRSASSPNPVSSLTPGLSADAPGTTTFYPCSLLDIPLLLGATAKNISHVRVRYRTDKSIKIVYKQTFSNGRLTI
jgi:hypothetical protein